MLGEEMIKYEVPEGHKKVEFTYENITLHFDWCPESKSYYIQITDTRAGNFSIIDVTNDHLVAKDSFKISKIFATGIHNITELKSCIERELDRNIKLYQEPSQEISNTTNDVISLTRDKTKISMSA